MQQYTSHKCELFNYCYMCFVFDLAYKLNTSVDGHNCRNSCHKIADNFSLSACAVRYFLGQYMWPFK